MAVALHDNYQPPITLQTWPPQLTKTITVSGDSVDNLAFNVQLDAGSNRMDTPPVYRVELLGTWRENRDIVLEKEDVLTVSQGVASATLSGFDDYIGEATDLKVRIWYAASGLGEVYTYHDTDIPTEANIKELLGVDDEDQPIWQYTKSAVIENYRNHFDNYMYTQGSLFTWLPAPVLNDVGTVLTPIYGADDTISYKFTWDIGTNYTDGARYKVTLTGIDENDREVVITSEQEVDTNSFTIDATSWDYQNVKLKVTRIGDEASKQIGRSSTGTYQIRPRLETPGSPTVTITDENELMYNLTWSKITSEAGCKSYQPYIRVYDGDTLGGAIELGDPVLVDKNVNGSYTVQRDLEDYAGKKVVIYVVAKATPNGSYLDSLPGITAEITVPDRLAEPKVTWSNNWQYDINNPLAAENFRNGGMKVSVTANEGSIPPGGSTYLLRAYIYDSVDDANMADPKKAAAVYPLTYGYTGVPAQMEMQNATNYYHNLTDMKLQYAGKWMVFYARISSGSGSVSSRWTSIGQVYRLPYVKLDEPDLSSYTKDTDLTVNVSTTPHVSGVDETWAAERTAVNWQSVDGADLYKMDLTGTVKGSGSSADPFKSSVRIKELKDSVQVEYLKGGNWMSISSEENADGSSTYVIPDYQVDIKGSYGAKYYTLTLKAELIVSSTDDGYAYTLILPDVEEMMDENATSVKNDNFKVTDKVEITSDVQENLDGISDAFVASETAEVTWNR